MYKPKKLHELINSGYSDMSDWVTDDNLQTYGKSLFVYYQSLFNCAPIFVAASVTNSGFAGYIVPAEDLHQAIEDIINIDNSEDSPEDKEICREQYLYNSRYLQDLITLKS